MLIALQSAAVGELYRVLAAAGFDALSPASAPIFQYVRPGGSDIEEIARLAGSTVTAIEEQVTALEHAGYALRRGDATVDLTARGRAAAELGLRTLADLEGRWRALMGEPAFSAFAGTIAQLNLDPLGRRRH